MKIHTTAAHLFFLLVTLAWPLGASAQAEVNVPVQGLVTDAEELPLDADVRVTFKLYVSDAEPEPAWSETQTVSVEDGLFTTYLGSVEPLDAQIFASERSLYFTMTIEGDDESSRIPLASAPYAAAAAFADDASTLQGKTPEELVPPTPGAGEIAFDNSAGDLQAATTQAALDELLERVVALERSNTTLQARVETLELENTDAGVRIAALEVESSQQAARLTAAEQTLTGLQGQVNMTTQAMSGVDARLTGVEASVTAQGSRVGAVEMSVTGLDTRITTIEGSVTSQGSRLGAVETSVAGLTGLGTRVSDVEAGVAALGAQVSSVQSSTSTFGADIASVQARATALETKTMNMTADADNVYFTGVNLHVRNGTGSTTGMVNGKGNLVVGYDAAKATDSDKSGSHNIVLGDRNNYTSYGGFVGGDNNTISASYAVVLAADGATASGSRSVVVTGYQGEATNTTAVVIGGYSNKATGFRSVTVGGWENDANGSYSSILGGSGNQTTASESSIGGGAGITSTTSDRWSGQIGRAHV